MRRVAVAALVACACNAPLLLAEGSGDAPTGFFAQPDAPFTPTEASPDATEEWVWVFPHGEAGLAPEGDARDTIRSDADTDGDAQDDDAQDGGPDAP